VYGVSGVCESSDTVNIDLVPQITPSLYIDTIACLEESFFYSPNETWYYNGIAIETVILDSPGTYTFEETNACETVTHQIEIDFEECQCNLYVPNSFTPDGESTNNTFFAQSVCDLVDFELTVYDRWGEIIFRTTDQYQAWDGTFKGKQVQDGSYNWKIQYMLAEDNTDDVILIHGHITVIR
jgi:gliding motility-associated-like protein